MSSMEFLNRFLLGRGQGLRQPSVRELQVTFPGHAVAAHFALPEDLLAASMSVPMNLWEKPWVSRQNVPLIRVMSPRCSAIRASRATSPIFGWRKARPTLEERGEAT